MDDFEKGYREAVTTYTQLLLKMPKSFSLLGNELIVPFNNVCNVIETMHYGGNINDILDAYIKMEKRGEK